MGALSFSEAAVIEALATGRLAGYAVDLPSPRPAGPSTRDLPDERRPPASTILPIRCG